MADEPEPTEVHIDVEVPTQEPAPAPEPAPEQLQPEPEPVVEVHHHEAGNSGDGGIHPDVAQFMADTRVALEQLTARTEGAENTAASAHDTATAANEAVTSTVEEAQSIADQVASTVIDGTPTPSAEEDDSPHKPHWLFRPVRKSRR